MQEIMCGIDEAGRGCIAGSLFMVAVMLPSQYIAEFATLGIKDSKQLRFQQRNMIKEDIESYLLTHQGVSKILCFESHSIDTLGLATCLRKGLQGLYNFALAHHASSILFDGNTNFGIQGIKTLIKGDSKDVLIGAASILAKCAKDKEMLQLHAIFPQYDFHNNKGYLTKTHKQRIATHGYSAIHRKSYHIKSLESHLFS